MKIGLLADIHGNFVALEACLEKLKALGADQIYFMGDAVGYMPGEKQVISILKRERMYCQKGNHEDMMLVPSQQSLARESVYQLQRAKKNLAADEIAFIRSWPTHRIIELHERKILLVHGSPDDYLYGYVYPDSDLLSSYLNLAFDAVFTANTHRPLISSVGKTLFVNVGSIGLPRDQGNMSCFAVYDTLQNDCQIYRISFDVEQVLKLFGDKIDSSIIDCFTRRSLQVTGCQLD